MSELQASLLAIGLGVIIAVYVFGWWQQRRYRNKFSAAFKVNHSDALYQPGDAGLAARVQQSPSAETVDSAADVETITDAETKEVPAAELSATNLLDDSCALLDARSDFIIELNLSEPSHAAVLDGLWQRKFDFRKPVQVCGLTLGTKNWERVIAESQVLYSRFRIALQLVDRGGAISETKLADFKDLVLGVAGHIKADTTVPDIRETHHHALEMDAFCAEVDQMVGVNLVPPGTRLLRGRKIAQAGSLLGMTTGSGWRVSLAGCAGTHTVQPDQPGQQTVPASHPGNFQHGGHHLVARRSARGRSRPAVRPDDARCARVGP